MIDITQFILIGVVVSLTVVMIIIGFHTIGILKELRLTISKMNKILDNAGSISESVARPISAFSGFLLGVKGIKLLDGVTNILKKHKKNSGINKSENKGEEDV